MARSPTSSGLVTEMGPLRELPAKEEAPPEFRKPEEGLSFNGVRQSLYHKFGKRATDWGTILLVVGVGICICMSAPFVAVGAVVVAGVSAILNLPPIKMLFEQDKLQKQLPAGVKDHVWSQEFLEFIEKMYDDHAHLGLLEALKKQYSPQLMKDKFFNQTYKADTPVEKFDFVICFQYFETLQYIKEKKISLSELGTTKRPSSPALLPLGYEREKLMGDLPDHIQKHVESEEFQAFCDRAFNAQLVASGNNQDILGRPVIPPKNAMNAVVKAYGTELCKDGHLQLAWQEGGEFSAFDANDVRVVFKYMECKKYQKEKMTSLRAPGTKVPPNFKTKRPQPTRRFSKAVGN